MLFQSEWGESVLQKPPLTRIFRILPAAAPSLEASGPSCGSELAPLAHCERVGRKGCQETSTCSKRVAAPVALLGSELAPLAHCQRMGRKWSGKPPLACRSLAVRLRLEPSWEANSPLSPGSGASGSCGACEEGLLIRDIQRVGRRGELSM